MDLQIALDRIPLDLAVEMTTRVAGLVDGIEVGTSLVKQYGMAGVADVVAAASATPVLADLKTVDDAEFELRLAYDAGARSATVLGLAPRATLDAATRVARERDRELVVDLMGLAPAAMKDVADHVPQSVVLAPHVSKDLQATDSHPRDLLQPWMWGRHLALAGGLGVRDLAELKAVPHLRVVVGSAVTKADDPIAAVRDLRRAAGKERSP